MDLSALAGARLDAGDTGAEAAAARRAAALPLAGAARELWSQVTRSPNPKPTPNLNLNLSPGPSPSPNPMTRTL